MTKYEFYQEFTNATGKHIDKVRCSWDRATYWYTIHVLLVGWRYDDIGIKVLFYEGESEKRPNIFTKKYLNYFINVVGIKESMM